jgi:hypothetical protein
MTTNMLLSDSFGNKLGVSLWSVLGQGFFSSTRPINHNILDLQYLFVLVQPRDSACWGPWTHVIYGSTGRWQLRLKRCGSRSQSALRIAKLSGIFLITQKQASSRLLCHSSSGEDTSTLRHTLRHLLPCKIILNPIHTPRSPKIQQRIKSQAFPHPGAKDPLVSCNSAQRQFACTGKSASPREKQSQDRSQMHSGNNEA